LNWNVQKGFLLLVGARNIEQVKENLGATGWKLDNSEIEVLDTVARKTKKQFVQNSFQSN
jgi:pyridoxine 4-dehydrogenase